MAEYNQTRSDFEIIGTLKGVDVATLRAIDLALEEAVRLANEGTTEISPENLSVARESSGLVSSALLTLSNQ